MIGVRTCASAVLLSLLLGHVVRADTLTLDAAHFGWYSCHDSGGGAHEYFSLLDNSYFAGRYTDSDDYMAEYRNFLVFDLSTPTLADKRIVGATLKIDTLAIAGGTHTCELSHVSTPVSELMAGSPNSDDIFDDLANGTGWGSCDILQPNTVVQIALNSEFVEAADGTRELFAIGGALALTPGSSADEFAFGYAGRMALPQLVLQTVPIPEPGTLAFLFIGTVSLLAFARRRHARRLR
jgi:hypothetical protein